MIDSPGPLRTLLVKGLRHVAGGTGLFVPRALQSSVAAGNVLVLSPGALPTADYYLAPDRSAFAGRNVRRVDTLVMEPDRIEPGSGTHVLIVRHAPLPWLRWLARHRAALGNVIYLMDDDIPGALCAAELPFRYALRTAWRYALARRPLARLCSAVWVSTPELQRRYPRSTPLLCEPGYVAGARHAAPAAGENVFFYHGTWAHRREIAWLVPIVAAVLRECPDARFEIIGGTGVRRLFGGMSGVRVLAPMSWPDYLAYAATLKYRVGLAPCFDTPFNRARSHVKLFDITRFGAAGIYSDLEPYSAVLAHGETGLLCANRAQDWTRAIVDLMNNPAACERINAKAFAYCTTQLPRTPELA